MKIYRTVIRESQLGHTGVVIYSRKPLTWPVVRKQLKTWIKKEDAEILKDDVNHEAIAATRQRLRRIQQMLPIDAKGLASLDDMYIQDGGHLSIDEIEVI